MLAALDVAYALTRSSAACVLFEHWTAPNPTSESVVSVAPARPYQPGRFYLRELPALLAVLSTVPQLPSVILIDGYVWLGPEVPGLGARLYESLAGAIPIVGVAKSPYRTAEWATPVLRGRSRVPLLVTAVGMGVGAAAEGVRSMHGAFRVPTLLHHVDHLARRGLSQGDRGT